MLIDDFLVIQILCVFVFVLSLATFVTKNYFSVVNFVFVGVYLPLFLFTFRWSEFIPETLQFEFLYIFLCLTILVFIYYIVTFEQQIGKIVGIDATERSRYIIPILNVVYIAAYLFENLYLSGFLFPSLHGIDIHVDGVSVIRYLTASMQVVLVANYFYWKAVKHYGYLLLNLIIILMPVVTRGARMTAFQGVFLLFVVFIWVDVYSNKNFWRITKMIFFGVLLLIPLVVLFDYITEYRSELLYGASGVYYEAIKYCGPDWSKFLAKYYGYFPMSFGNLNLRLSELSPDLNYLGLSTFYPIYYAILHIHMFSEYSPDFAESIPCYYTAAASVPTGFWHYYLDFGYFFFIPIIMALFFNYYLLLKSSGEKHTIVWRVLYFWYVSKWILMSFQNFLFEANMLYTAILLYVVLKLSFRVKQGL